MRKAGTVLILLIILAAHTAVCFSQSGSYFNQRDDQYRLLGLKRAKHAYEVAKKEYERKEDLHQKGLITDAALEQAFSIFSDAEVNFQQSLLAVLFEQQYVTVEKAVKYHKENGSIHVLLTLRNMSSGSAEFQHLLDDDDELLRSLRPGVIHNVYVSLLNENNAIISQPYEAKIAELHYGKPTEIDFELLEDLDAVTVDMIYSNGTQRNMKIYLQKDKSINRVEVQSGQFSQEVELGVDAAFDLTLELFSSAENTFSLEVVNLPRQITRYFRSADGSVRLRQVKFTESTHTKRAALVVSLPDRPGSGVQIDKAIPFYVLAIPRDRKAEIGNLDDHNWTADELDSLDIGYVRLELVPRGKGELLVKSRQLYFSARPGEEIPMYFELLNEGSHRLDNVVIETDLPLDWRSEIMPSELESLGIGKEKRIDFRFIPPSDIEVGRYQIRIRTSALSAGQTINGEDKTVTIEIMARANILGTLIVAVLIIGLVVGVVVFGIRLSRK